MRGRLYLDTMHANRVNLIMCIFWSNGLIWKSNILSGPLESLDHFYDMQW